MKNYFFTSESVTEGHPDKLCDNIADNILDECLKQDEFSRVAVEVMVSKNIVYVSGQITTNAKINIGEIVRNRIKEIGYNDENTDINYKTCEILINITEQSREIADIIGNSGAGDQGTIYGFACSETEEYMPLPIVMANELANILTNARKYNIITGLRPDGKTQVTVRYKEHKPFIISDIIISTQHIENKNLDLLRREILENVVMKSRFSYLINKDTKININKNGKFVIGGPLADTGLTGRKLMVDSYGGMSKHRRWSLFRKRRK